MAENRQTEVLSMKSFSHQWSLSSTRTIPVYHYSREHVQKVWLIEGGADEIENQ